MNIPEEQSAWGAYQFLRSHKQNPEEFETKFNEIRTLRPDVDPLANARQTLAAYTTRQRATGKPLFPTYAAQATAKRTEGLAKLYTEPLENTLAPDRFEKLQKQASFTANPEEFKLRAVNREFISTIAGKPIPAEQYPFVRAMYAKQHLKLSPNAGEAEVFNAIKTRITEDKTATEAVRTIAMEEMRASLEGNPRTAPDLSAIPERLRLPVQEQILENRASARERIRQARPAVMEIMAKIKPIAEEFAKEGDPTQPKSRVQATRYTWFDIAKLLPRDPAAKNITFALLQREIQSLPQSQRDGLGQIGESIARGVDEAGASMLNIGVEGVSQVIERFPMGKDQRQTFATASQARVDSTYLRRMVEGQADPLEQADDWIVTKSLVLAGQSAWMLPASFAGPAGWSAIAGTLAGDSFQQARLETPEARRGAQFTAALGSGTVQAAQEVVLNKIGMKIVGGKLPGLAGILNKSGVFNPVKRAAIAAVASAPAVIATEYTEEALQAGTDRLAQDLAKEFSGIAPNTDWKGFFGDWLTVGGQEQRDTLLAILPFAAVGAGGASFNHFRYGRDLARNRTVLEAVGVPKAIIEEMVDTTDVQKTDQLFKQAFETGLEERTREEKSKVLEVMRELNQLHAALDIDRITRESEHTYTYTSPLTGESTQYETEDEALLAWRQEATEQNQDNLDKITRGTRDETVDFLTTEGKASEETQTEDIDRLEYLTERAKKSKEAKAQLDIRLKAYALERGITPAQVEQELESLTIRAQRFTETSRDGQLRYAVQLFVNADPLDAIEDLGEDMLVRAFDLSLESPASILKHLRTYESATGESLVDPDYTHDPSNLLPIIEGFSSLVRATAIGQARSGRLPEALSKWVEIVAAYGANTIDLAQSSYYPDLKRAASLKKAVAAGQLPQSFLNTLEDALGINETEQFRRMEAKHRDQLAAEAMQGFPEISEQTAGRIPHPETLRKNQHPLAGEVRRIWDSLKKPTRRRDKSGRTLDRTNEANAFFLPVGEMVDLDDIREALNEKGFDFETPADMLDALESSLSYNKPVYGTNSRGNDSFSIGTAPTTQQDTAYLAAVKAGDMETAQRMVDAAAKAAGYNIGPVWHGTDAEGFTTFKRNGFELFFFSENKEYAKQYGKNLISAYLRITKGAKTKTELTAMESTTSGRVELWSKFTGENAFDGIVSYPENGNQETVVRNPNQIKSADPVTYDEAGNVIPLSQRFDSTKDSISFSIGTRRVMPSDYPATAREVVSTTNIQGITQALLKDGESLVPLDDSKEKPMKVSPAYKAAKRGGDKQAAWDIALLFLTGKRVTPYKAAIGDSSPVFVPIRQEEGAKQNLLPLAAAWVLQKQLGGRVADTVLQLKKGGLTGADNNERSKKDHDFEGALEMQPGETVVLIDDTFTSGSTLTSLYDHLSAQGIEAEHIFSIASGRYTKNIAASAEQITRALDKVGMSEEEFQRAIGIPIQAFTGAELAAYSLNGARGIEGFALRFDVRGNTGSGSILPSADAGLDAAFSLGHATVTPTASTRTFQGQDGQTVIGPASFAIGAFHGTPHKVDKFTTEKIGTGEGAQAYGWGLYFAGSETVARYYRDNVRPDVSPELRDFMRETGMTDFGKIAKALEDYISKYPQWKEAETPTLEEARRMAATSGNLYTVTLKLEDDQLLDWDKPLAEQSDKVKSAISAEMKRIGGSASTGEQAYKELMFQARMDGNASADSQSMRDNPEAKAAADRLTEIGIRGIRYLDSNSRVSPLQISAARKSVESWRGRDADQLRYAERELAELLKKQAEGSYNFVIFDEADIEILEENGQPVNLSNPQSSFSLGPAALMRLERAIASRITAGPDERGAFYSRVRNRLAATVQRLEDMDAGVGMFARNPADEAGTERRRVLDAIAEARAITDALPPEARGRVRIDFDDITSKETDKGRVKALLRLLNEADAALEIVLKESYLESIDRVLDLAQPEVKQNKQIKGKLTPETQRKIADITAAIRLTNTKATIARTQAQAAFDALEAAKPDEIDASAVEEWEAALASAQETLDILDTFSGLEEQTAADLALAKEQLLAIYTTGRTKRRTLEEARRQQLAEAKREVIESLGGLPSQPQWKRRVDDDGFLDKLEALRLGHVSFHEFLEWTLPTSIFTRDMQRAIRAADRAVTGERIAARDRFEQSMYAAYNLTGRSRKRRLNRIIADLSTTRSDWNIEIREGTKFEAEKMSEEQAAAILDGTLKPGWESDPIAIESLRQALSDFRRERRTARDKQKAFSKKVVKFRRLTQRGAPAFIRFTDLEALYHLQLAAQAQYLPTLDRHGFTAEVLKKMEEKLDPRALPILAHLKREYAAQWGKLNPVHQRLFGMDMPRILNYAPGYFESSTGTDTNLTAEGGGGALSAMAAGFTKVRSNHLARPKQISALAAYWRSMETTEYFIAWAEPMRDLRAVFRSPDVRRTFEGKYGTRALREFMTWLDVLENDGTARAAESAALSEMTSKLLTSQSAIGLSWNIGTLFKQWSAGAGLFMLAPTGKAAAAFKNALLFPRKGQFSEIWNNQAIQQRILAGMNPEDRRLMEQANQSPSRLMAFLEAGRVPIGYTDAFFSAITGLTAYRYQYDAALKSGMADSAAHSVAMDYMDYVITRTAQPATTQDKSLSENTAKGFTRSLYLFKSDPRQKLSFAVSALRLAARGDIKKMDAARRVFFSWMIYGLMAQVATDVWRTISRDGDDEENWQPQDYIAAMIAGPISGLALIGSVLEYTIRSIVGSKAYGNNPNPVDKAVATLAQTIRSTSQITEGDVDLEEIITISNAMRTSSAMAQIVGVFDSRAAAAPAALRLLRDTFGILTNTADLVSPDSPADTAARIIREEAEVAKDGSKTRTETNKDIAAELAKLSAPQREKRLRAMEPAQRRAVSHILLRRDMTPDERKLANLPTAAREKAITRILAELDPEDQVTFRDRMDELGFLPEQ